MTIKIFIHDIKRKYLKPKTPEIISGHIRMSQSASKKPSKIRKTSHPCENGKHISSVTSNICTDL